MNRARTIIYLLILSVASFDAIGQLPPAPPAPPSDVNAPPSAEGVAKELVEIQDWTRWTKMAQSGDAFMLGIQFDGWARLIIRLTREDRRDEVDRLCDAIVLLHSHLPDKSVQAHGNVAEISFVRDAFGIGNRRVEAAQYWLPERDDSIGPELVKLYRFSVLNGKDVERQYILERRQRGAQYFYTLGEMDPRTHTHDLVLTYGSAAPTYWTLLRDVLRAINDPHPPKALY